jgi:hypothetical protein
MYSIYTYTAMRRNLGVTQDRDTTVSSCAQPRKLSTNGWASMYLVVFDYIDLEIQTLGKIIIKIFCISGLGNIHSISGYLSFAKNNLISYQGICFTMNGCSQQHW